MSSRLGDALVVRPVLDVPEVRPGDDVAALLAPALQDLAQPAVVVVSSKVLSKAAGLVVAGRSRDDVVAEQSVRVVAERLSEAGVTRVVEAVAGPVMAAAGVDASNTGGEDVVLVLPTDPDAAAADLRSALLTALGNAATSPLAVVVTDTAGRPWRAGLTDFALGCAGLVPALDHRGEVDHDGRTMAVTVRAVADELAAAADLVRGKADGIPAAVVTGVPAAWFDEHAVGARSLVRTGPADWFALGHVEAVRAALGATPGSPASDAIGLRSVVPDEALTARVARVVALALLGEELAGCDVEVDASGATVTVGAEDDVAVGRLLARLEVAAFAEDLSTTPLSPHALRLTPTHPVSLHAPCA